MGLDMYLFKVSRPSYTDNTSYFSKTEVENNPDLFSKTFLNTLKGVAFPHLCLGQVAGKTHFQLNFLRNML